MAQRFKTAELQLTKQLVTASGDGLLYVNGNPVVAGVSGALNQTGLYLVSQIYATGQSAVVHANGIGSGLSGQLFQSGSALLAVIANTGSQAWNAANNNSINLSGNLAQTGATLITRDLIISGVLATGIAQTGSASVSHANGIGINLSGNLAQTGSNLYALITGASGQAATDFATKAQLTQTGATLQSRINDLSGFVGQVSGGLETRIAQTGQAGVLYASGASGALQAQITSLSGYTTLMSGGLEVRIAQTGSAAVNHANSIGTIISGNLTQTGSTLNNRVNSLSGWADQIFVHRTGQELISGRKIFRSSPVLTGIEFAGQSSSGIYVSTQTDGAVSFAGPSGSALFIDSGINGSVFAVTNQYEAPYLDIYEDGRIYMGDFLTNAVFISGSGAAFGAAFVPSGYRVFISGNTQYIGDIFSGTTGGQAVNIVNLYYPRSNPSGFITGLAGTGSLATLTQLNSLSGFVISASGGLETRIVATGTSAVNHANGIGINLSGNLTQTGATLQGRITSLSGWTDQIFVHRTGAELISGSKTFVSTTYVDLIGPISIVGPFINLSTGELQVGGIASVGWANRELLDNGASTSLNWQNRYLYTNLGTPTLDWENRILTGGAWTVFSWNNNSGSLVNWFRLSGASGFLQNQVAATGGAAVVFAQNVSGYYRENLTTVTSNYSVLASDRVFLCNNTAPATLTFPSSAVCSGIPFEIKMINTGAIYLTGVAGQTFDGQPSYNIIGQWQVRKVRPDGSNFYIF